MNIFHTVVCSAMLAFVLASAFDNPPMWSRIACAAVVGLFVYVVEKRAERKAERADL